MKRYSVLLLMILASLHIAAQTPAIRYVSKSGAYGNSGESWGQAMNNIQDAINAVAVSGGYVFVAKGTYTPTESTESTGGSTLYMSFKIPAGVKVYGGFKGDETGADAEAIIAKRDAALTSTELGSFFRDADHETILSGNLSAKCEFNWNNTKEIYDPTFYGNTYHVVWFALGTKQVADKEYKGFDADGKAIPLAKEAVLDGFTITGGHAYNNSVTGNEHNAYGGGAYMVKNSVVRNCQFYNCDASRDGGAIYMNGGGKVDKCFIHNCQALGLGVLSGFGGGICMDGGNAEVLHTALVNNVARMGGGLATSYQPSISTDKFGLIVASCVMSSNVATTEGGGAYLDGAGLMTNCTVVRNKCNGSGVTSNGMITGRAASVYIRDHAHIYNSVLWGGKCDANNDIQYANSRSDINNTSLKPELRYVALNEADHVDWSGTTKNNVFKLAAYNDQASATAAGVTVPATEGFPMFDRPAPSAGHGTEETNPDTWTWHTKALSYLNHKGILISDLTASCGDLPSGMDHLSIKGDKYITHCTLGAYTSAIPTIVPQEAGSNTYNIYVDPSRNAGTDGSIGASWDAPVLFLGDALYKADELSKEGKKVNIYMKEGVANNTNSYTSDRARDISFNVPNNTHIYGGYPKGNAGTDLSGRNPVEHPTVLSGNIHGDYNLNVAHLVSFIPGVTDATLDGVQIRYANARSDQMTDHNNTNSRDGAAIFVYGATGVKIKNVTVAHCTARNGAGLFAIHNSAVTLENCIFHNNEAKQSSTLGGIIYADGGSTISMNHCDVIRNVGNAFVSENTTAQTINNSVFYANMRSSQADTNGKAEQTTSTPLKGAFTGSNNLFDEKTQLGTTDLPATLAVATKTVDEKTYGTLSFNRSDNANYPRFVNPTKNAGVSTGGDITYYGRAVSFEPTNLNPMVNAASTGDVAHTSSSSWGYDITGVVTRDFGGRPDIGAVENHASDENKNNQPEYGSVMYVRDYGSDTSTANRDGSSWATAINGNGTYSGSVKGLQYAVNNGAGKEVWVAGGTYTGNFTMQEGVNVLGGFAKTGNPGKNERDISNADDNYKTTLDAQATTSDNRRPLTQRQTFSVETLWEGFTLTGGHVIESYDPNGSNALIGGGGAYLLDGGRLKNCLITNNAVLRNVSTLITAGGGGGVANLGGKMESCKVIENYIGGSVTGGTFVVTGGGVYLGAGANLTNCVIAKNEGGNTTTALAKTGGKSITNVLGGGVGVANTTLKSSFTNCTIIDNTGAGSAAVAGGVWDFSAQSNGGGGYYLNCIITGNRAKSGTNENYHQLSAGLRSDAKCKNVFNTYIAIANITTVGATYNMEATTVQYAAERNIVAPKKSDIGVTGNSTTINVDGQNYSISFDDDGYFKTTSSDKSADVDAFYAFCKLTSPVDWDTYELKENSPCINTGNENFVNGSLVNLKEPADQSVIVSNLQMPVIDEDSNGAERIQDCAVDMGAYEFNGSYAITPRGSQLVYSIPTINARDLSTITSYNQYLTGLTATVAGVDVELYNNSAVPTAPTMYNVTSNLNVTAGEKITFTYNFNNTTKTKTLVAHFYIDKDGDGTFDEESLKGSENRDNDFDSDNLKTYTVPTDALNGPTYLRLRLESAWNTSDNDANAETNRLVYDIPLTVSGSSAGTNENNDQQAIFYVTPNGAGTASAENPANAACAAKLQKVIDAAGRYKYNNPTKQVIVKVANSASLQTAGTPFKYYATRTTDVNDENVRTWSIMIPRGVEVWGGYSDGNNFASRNITGNPTYFDSYYMNKEAQSAVHTYHVVTFTDKVFDENGNVMTDGAPEPTELSMASQTSDRAIIDGIFITGGQADGEDFAGTGSVNINQYGGAAIVTDYAHVRNCILKDNTATYGGALALTHGALVSGSLFLENEANHGGALYVFEDATQLSDGTEIATTNTGAGSIDLNMPHVYTSTIVNNNATQQGGGVWFGNADANVRFNSCVLWQNDSPDQANVAGVVAPNGGDNTQTLQVYPFAYSAVQNQRMPGTNNITIATDNKSGARFNTPTDAYYGLQEYSALLQNGMPITEYNDLKTNDNLAANDFTGIDRLISTSGTRAYIEIGARALDYASTFNADKLLLRLFVSEPQYVNMDAAETMMKSTDPYYKQEGSSFAFPFQKLDQALDYIIKARQTLKGKANNLPFEIFIGKGEYHPSRDLAGNYGYSLANTFLVPEGVSIYGGFDPKGGGDHAFLGQYWVPKYDGDEITIDTSVDSKTGYFFVANNTNNVVAKTDGNSFGGYTFSQIGVHDAIKLRDIADINANNIIEPWEFKNQTVLSGAATNMSSEGVYHVITIVADETLVGTLPKASITHNAAAAAKDPTLFDYTQQTYGSYDYEEGQTVTLNGLMVTGGRAYGYTNGSLDEVGEYSYYHGGGVLVDGNRYCDWYNKNDGAGNGIPITGPSIPGGSVYVVTPTQTPQYLHTGVSQAVGFRDIPVSIESCKFVDNIAGYGGAINSNGTIDIFNCSLEQNKAMSGEDQDLNGTGKNVQYPGNGGAVYGTHQVSFFNTLLANNEAYDKGMIESATSAENPGPQPRTFQTFRNQTPTTEILGGCGGAFFGGQFSHFHIVNSDFVRNQACVYPAAFTMNPNQDFQKVLTGTVELAPGNDVPAHAALMTPMYNQFTNTVFWGNDIHPDMKAWDNNEVFKTNSRLICNYGSATRGTAYNCRWNATDNDGTAYAHPQTLADLDDDSKFGETAWFCAYEQRTGIKQNNLKDYRDLDYSPIGYAKTQIMSYGVDYQNCNIVIASDNFDLDGPNFVSPSMKPGIEGYTESADWSPARLNKLTDQGSGKIQQTISIVGDTYQSTFDTYTDDSQVPAARKDYSNETTGDFITSGAYTMTRYLDNYPKYNENLMLGEERYMESATTTQKLWRISYDPNPTHNQTYIDIGVYEYPHTELKWTSEGDEVDILWVSPIEKPENGLPEGSAWTQPTSDLQRAIETLLASRNGHRKEIRLMDGQFTPIYTIEDNLSFYFNTEYVNQSVMMPENWEQEANKERFSVKSFTIKGGYSRDQNNMYDVDQFPAVIRGQQRTDGTGTQWNHAFYIKDAIQRYGNEVSDANAQGAFALFSQGKTPVATTIPIEFYGVTFVNDQALSNTQGAALCYEDQKVVYTGSKFEAKTYEAEAPKTANLRLITYYTDDTYTTPSPNNAPTEYVKYQDITDPQTPVVLDKNGTPAYTPAKLVLANCRVMASGTHYDSSHQNDKTSSAVFIGKGGGSALLYNDLMHSNYGNPLVSMCNTEIINNTIALNAGMVDLGGEITLDQDGEGAQGGIQLIGPRRKAGALDTPTSKIFNTIMWRNNVKSTDPSAPLYGQQFSLPGYVSDAASGSIFARNAYTYKTGTGETDVTQATDYISTGPETLASQNYNVRLSNTNADLIYGPNFIDPENADIESRNFKLTPSLRLLNKGDNSYYKSSLPAHNDANAEHWKFNIYDYAWEALPAVDAGSAQRVMFTNIDLGAFEYQNSLNRVVYVNPNTMYSAGQDGMGWATALGGNSIQTAIDLAGLYHINNDQHEAYVLVKGNVYPTNKDNETGETLTLRDGVSVIGSIDPEYVTNIPYATDPITGAISFVEADITNGLAEIINLRKGLAAPNANRTIISGVRTNDNTRYNASHNTFAGIDGFEIHGGDVTEPVINVNPHAAAGESVIMGLRNIIVRDTKVTGTNTNVANVGNALLYEVLMRDNTPGDGGAVLNLTDGGYLVSGTIEGTTKETTGGNVAYPTSTGSNARTFNSLVNYGSEAWITNTLSGYSYHMANKNQNYQLTEGSKNIDVCATTVPAGLPASLATFIDYTTDRDLLGNPRLLKLNGEETNTLDRGAFETWKIAQDVVATSNTNATYNGWTGTNYYPHDGSVVYIMEGKSLNSGADLHPGFLLLQNGANLYGGGHRVDANYLAVERNVSKTGALLSLPYDMNYATGAQYPSYAADEAANKGELTLTAVDHAKAQAYNGLMRSEPDYKLLNSDSPCWSDIASDATVEASKGVLFTYTNDGAAAANLIRFTGNSGDFETPIYTESGNSKVVELTQYNAGGRAATVPEGSPEGANGNTGDNTDFTDAEDMGWNAIGLPYLVSDYNPAATERFTGNDLNNMHIPHELWLYYDGTVNLSGTVNKNGANFYPVNSWENTADAWHLPSGNPSIWVGEGFFLQTATLQDTEALTFHRPVYGAPVSPISGKRLYQTTDLDEIANNGAYIVATRYYAPNGIQLAKPVRGVNIAVDIYSDGTKRTRKFQK